MAFKMPHITVIIGLVAAGIALLFQIIAVAAVGWLKYQQPGYDLAVGLWRSCLSDFCSDISSSVLSDSFQATRAFSLLGLIFIAVALAVGIFIMFIDNKLLPLIAGGVACTAALCVLISFAIFADDKSSSAYKVADLSYCFALTVVAFVLCIGSGVCFIVSKFFESSSS